MIERSRLRYVCVLCVPRAILNLIAEIMTIFGIDSIRQSIGLSARSA